MKQCPQCHRTYDDSQSFCLMDGTPLIVEREEETVVRQKTAPPKKSRILLWLGLIGLLAVMGFVLVAGFLIYEYKVKGENAQANRPGNLSSSSSSPTPSSTLKATPTPEAATSTPAENSSPVSNSSPVANASPKTEKDSTKYDDPDDVTPINWDTTGVGFKMDVGMVYKFRCPEKGTEHTIWGTDVYTSDSSICTAAVHAGLFSLADGGIVTIEFRPGRLTYGTTERNGIKSNTFGEYGHSFVVR